ncbi:glycine N-methyltransferase-like [Amphiura filiformis]|uniref:glycine N-methyltransferase-like n=1 Tax=Amphiura filiformis TaxID=82378 RepID=UPI003B214AFC
MGDSIYRTRSLGVSDQYADGKAAKVWEHYIGSRSERTEVYREWLVKLLRDRGCQRVLDVACGTGIDSVMLLKEGFKVMSCDLSDKMVMHAFRERWARRKEAAFDEWEIDVANWLTLDGDISKPGDGFDAIICIGNSFAHLPDFDGTQSSHRRALRNFAKMLKPGGVMIIDHRNYDAILDTGKAPEKNIYYHGSSIKDITTSVTYVDAKPATITLDYFLDTSLAPEHNNNNNKVVQNGGSPPRHKDKDVEEDTIFRFQLTYYPHRLNSFTSLLYECFDNHITHTVYGDYKPKGEVETPAYYIHVVEKNL